MREFNFTVRVHGFDADDDVQLDRLYSAPFSIVAAEIDGETELDATILASTERHAWHIFNRFLADRLPEVHILRINLDLVSLSEIADRCDISRETVRLWSTGKRRSAFPTSFTTTGSMKLWAWSEVFRWLIQQNVPVQDLYSAEPLSIEYIEACNGFQARRRQWSRDGDSAWTVTARSESNVIQFTPRTATPAVRVNHVQGYTRPVKKAAMV
ncbi:hypothetical protein [Arthrobacter sp. D2-10]